MKRPVLIIMHRAQSSPGRVGRWLLRKGYALDVRRPPLGDPLPDTLDAHSGAVVFGGPMSANDPEAWIRREIDWIRVPLRERVPFLGICLGAQMLARQLGASVQGHPGGRVEIGYWPIRSTRAGAAFGPWPERVYHWHSQGFGLTADMQRLASGEFFENQAVRYGPSAFGLQFHPEVSFQTMNRWAQSAPHKLQAAGAQDWPLQRQEGARHDRAGAAWLSGFLDTWLATGCRVDVNA